MQPKPRRAERLQIMLTRDELEAIEDFRFRHRMASRAAAVREVMRRGLIAKEGERSVGGLRSADIGVLAKGQRRTRREDR